MTMRPAGRVPEGTVETILSYCHATLQDDTIDKIVPYLQQKGIGIVAASALSMGLLSNRGPPDWHPAPKEVRETCAKAAAHAKSNGISIERLAIQHAFQKQSVSTVLIGMATPEEVKQNVKAALEALGKLENPNKVKEEKMMEEVKEILKPVHNQTWEVGRPENN
ncbi:hypothetical protein WJX84_008651 [Apatococcus fuscideae]|uniref:NADP-dependent oxidoreductase domain-containing protein n=1 Tax=Apatococcus fuscideae TaxID=2026836 RepID=A0AAW1TF95_9CHLO